MSGTLKLDLAQFRELEAFATFGSELDRVSQAQLDRGYRLTELLKQPQNQPVPVEEQVIVIYAGTKGWTDDVPVSEVQRFETELLEYLKAQPRLECSSTSATTRALPDEADARQGAVGVPRDASTPGRSTEPWPAAKSAILRRRIRSVQSTRKITKAMELIAASQIVRAQARIAANRPYREGMDARCVVRPRPATRTRRPKLLGTPEIVRRVGSSPSSVTAGLAGAYNSGVLRATERLVAEHRRTAPR